MFDVIKDIVDVVKSINEKIDSTIETSKLAREGGDQVAILLERAIAKARWKRKVSG